MSAAKSTRAKGNAWENRIREYLESLGWTVDKARATLIIPRGPGGKPRFRDGKMVVFSTPNDFFGCIDLIGLHRQKPYTLFIQATTSDAAARGAGEKLKEMLGVPWNLGHHRVQLWRKQESIVSGVRVLNLDVPAVSIGAQPTLEWRESFFRLKNGQPAPAEVL